MAHIDLIQERVDAEIWAQGARLRASRLQSQPDSGVEGLFHPLSNSQLSAIQNRTPPQPAPSQARSRILLGSEYGGGVHGPWYPGGQAPNMVRQSPGEESGRRPLGDLTEVAQGYLDPLDGLSALGSF